MDYIRLAVPTMMFLSLAELLLFQNLQLFCWSMVANMNEFHIRNSLILINFVISTLIFSLQVTFNEVYPKLHYFISGEMKNSSKFFIGGYVPTFINKVTFVQLIFL